LVFLSARVAAQTQTARLVGTVHDGSGASIPNAMVTATQEQTRQTAETATNTSGEYVFPSLQPGAYTLSVEAPGFRKVLVNGLQLDAAANLSQTVALEVGQVSETLEVRADAVSVQATDAQLNQSVTL
jgi:protocatechuate 3,4-dioxygenase beta subunit